jgi:hypothetical protein
MTVAGTVAMGSSFLRNRIINGDMRIDQRNAGVSVTNIAGGNYSVDRWGMFATQTSKFTAQQNAGSVAPPAGFPNYVGITSSSAYTLLSTDQFVLYQAIEGLNVSDLAWGSANARTITLSFWARSSLTGTFSGGLYNSAANRSYPFTYTISSANTWEQKFITVAGDTTGTWLVDNGVGIVVAFSLGTGANFQSTANTWAAGNFKNVSGAVNIVSTNGATFYITGVQIEAGTAATPFERRQFGQELALCQRYYQVGTVDARTYGTASQFYVQSYMTPPMRAVPTAAFTAAASASTNISGTPTLTVNDASTSLRLAYQATATADTFYIRAYSLAAEL